MAVLIHTPPRLIHTPRRAAGVGSGGLLGVEELAERVDVAPEVVVLAHLALDLLAAVEDGRVVAAAEGFTDAEQRRLGLLAHEVHRDLARQDDLLVAGLAAELIRGNAVVLRD